MSKKQRRTRRCFLCANTISRREPAESATTCSFQHNSPPGHKPLIGPECKNSHPFGWLLYLWYARHDLPRWGINFESRRTQQKSNHPCGVVAFLVRPTRFERATYRVGVCHSIQLSYGRVWNDCPKIIANSRTKVKQKKRPHGDIFCLKRRDLNRWRLFFGGWCDILKTI